MQLQCVGRLAIVIEVVMNACFFCLARFDPLLKHCPFDAGNVRRRQDLHVRQMGQVGP